jgi:hypothetical protein
MRRVVPAGDDPDASSCTRMRVQTAFAGCLEPGRGSGAMHFITRDASRGPATPSRNGAGR